MIKFCLSSRVSLLYRKQAQELYIAYRDYKSIELYLGEDYKDITLIIDLPAQVTPAELDILKSSLKIKKNIIFALHNISQIMEDHIENNFNNDFMWYIMTPCNSFMEARKLNVMGAQYIVLGETLFFNIKRLKDCGIDNVRIMPNQTTHTTSFMDEDDAICGPWARPEDLQLYDIFDTVVVEFPGCLPNREEALYRIYAETHRWPGSLAILLDNYTGTCENRMLPTEFTTHRLNCRQRCESCHICPNMVALANRVLAEGKDIKLFLEKKQCIIYLENLERICKMTDNEHKLLTALFQIYDQHQLKKLVSDIFVNSYGKENVEITHDYTFVKGDMPVMLCAHCDTVCWSPVKQVVALKDNDGAIKAYMNAKQEPLGADDRAGIFMILKIVSLKYRPYILLTTDEEIGGGGAIVAAEQLQIPQVKFILELDRMGSSDAAMYDCGNPDFIDMLSSYGYTPVNGTFSDICFFAPEWDIAAANLSVGYVHEHTQNEILYIDSMEQNLKRVCEILDNIENFQYYKFEEKAPQYSYTMKNYMATAAITAVKSNYRGKKNTIKIYPKKEGK